MSSNSTPHKLLLATRNKGKIEEFRRILEDIAAGQIELVGLDQFPNLHDVDETGSTFEENALMKAEALINTGQVNQGLALVDAVRTALGAGLAAVANTGLTQAQAQEELRRERRIALAFRGLSFYDARRYKISEPAAAGGGRAGCVVVSNAGTLNTNATIEYGYLDYWDVPDNELAYNPAASGSAPTKNPKQ